MRTTLQQLEIGSKVEIDGRIYTAARDLRCWENGSLDQIELHGEAKKNSRGIESFEIRTERPHTFVTVLEQE